MKRFLALDIGDMRIGVAMSDPEGILASPFIIMERIDETKDIEGISRIITEKDVGRVIVGLPRSLSGALGAQAAKVKKFTGKLQGLVDVPVEFRDERLTTVTAQRLMREARTKKSPRKKRDDAIAAAVLLQSYLDEVRESEKH
ncbi:MAG: Holliday junction resolvase RuvX [Chloroflexota bacterium]